MATIDSAFDVKSKTFAHISQDNRLHLWDVDTRKEKKGYVDKNHLSHNFTCFKWRSGKKDSQGEFVVGFSDGTLIVWDLARGVVSRTIGKANESDSPTDIAFSNDNNSIYVSSNQNKVNVYNLKTGAMEKSIKAGKKGIQKLAANPKSDMIAAASSSIRLVNVESEESTKLEASFSGGVAAMTFTACGRFLVAASANNREVLVFDVRKGADESPVLVVPVNGVVSGFDTRVLKAGGGGTVEVLVLFEDTGANVLRFSANYKQDGVDPLLSVTDIQTGNAQVSAGWLGSRSGDVEGKGVMLAVGQRSHPLFVHVDIEDGNGEPSKLVTVAEGQQQKTAEVGGETNGKISSGSSKAQPEVLGPHEMGGAKRPLVEEEVSSSSSKKSRKGAESNDLLVASAVPGELTLEQRLESLSRSMQQLEDEGEETPSGRSGAKGAQAAPTSDSLVTLIDQALQSGDDALLEQCLICGDNDVVEATARRLPTGRIVIFLRKLVAKFEKRPSRGVLLTRWLACILRYHTSYLVTVPDLSFQLAGLSQMLEQRLASYTRLSSLAGRLDLLLSQVTYQQQQQQHSNGHNGKLAQIVPRQTYQEE